MTAVAFELILATKSDGNVNIFFSDNLKPDKLKFVRLGYRFARVNVKTIFRIT